MKRLSYSNVMATVAVFVALGGTSYAAVTITGADVRDDTLDQRDIDNGAVRSGEVRDGSLRARDFSAGVLPRARIKASRRPTRTSTSTRAAPWSAGA